MSSEAHLQEDTDGVSDPKGFLAAAVSSDVRGKGDDLLDIGIVYSPSPCSAAGSTTTARGGEGSREGVRPGSEGKGFRLLGRHREP